jgi:bacterioferritin
MKGDQRIIDLLNKQLAREYGAIIQYTVHAATVANWGYDKLAGYMMARAKQEMGHADKLQDRILFLDGVPAVAQVPAFTGATVPEMMSQDLKGEMEARAAYNEIVKLCIQIGDNGTRMIAEANLAEEENHINDIESAQREIGDIKLPGYLAEQMEE